MESVQNVILQKAMRIIQIVRRVGNLDVSHGVTDICIATASEEYSRWSGKMPQVYHGLRKLMVRRGSWESCFQGAKRVVSATRKSHWL